MKMSLGRTAIDPCVWPAGTVPFKGGFGGGAGSALLLGPPSLWRKNGPAPFILRCAKRMFSLGRTQLVFWLSCLLFGFLVLAF